MSRREYFRQRVWISQPTYEDLKALKQRLDQVEPHVNHTLGGSVESLVHTFKDVLLERKEKRLARRKVAL